MRDLDIIKRITQSSVFISLGGFANVMGLLRLYESLEYPDANYDGGLTINDIGIHAKETFLLLVILSLAGSLGQVLVSLLK